MSMIDCIGGQTLLICSKLISFFCFFSLLTRFTWQRLTPVTNISVFWRFTTRCVHKRNLNKIGDNAWPDPRRYNKATLAERLRKKKTTSDQQDVTNGSILSYFTCTNNKKYRLKK